MSKINKYLGDFLKEQQLCIENTIENTQNILDLIQILIKTRDNGKKIFTMGNGGSGSTASHFVSDLLKTAIIQKKKRFQALALTDNVPVILAWSNDLSYDNIFVEQIKNFVTKGDMIIGFSGSGNSENLIKTFKRP